jgi:hypothetical protein
MKSDMGHFMVTLPAQNGFYEKTSAMTTKMPVFPQKRGKSTEEHIAKAHFPDGSELVFPCSQHTQPRTLSRQ